MEAVATGNGMVFSNWGNVFGKYEPVMRRGSKMFSAFTLFS